MKPKPPLHIWSLFRFKSLGGLRTQGCSWDFQTSGALPSLTKKGWMWITWSSVSNQVVPICTIRALILCCLEIPRVSLGGQLSAARHLPLLSSVQADGAIWVASCQVNEYFTKLMVNAKTKHLHSCSSTEQSIITSDMILTRGTSGRLKASPKGLL